MKQIPWVVLTILSFAAAAMSAQRPATVRQIDFENFRYAWNNPPVGVPSTWKWLRSAPDQYFRTVNGIHHFFLPDEDSYARQHAPLISVDSVSYGDLDGDGIEEAIVALNYSTGGTANWDYLYVYKLRRGQPKLLARMQTGSRADGGLVRAFVHENLLIVDFADSEKRVGDCCSEGYIRVSYRWRDGAFVEEGQREHGKVDLQEGPPSPGSATTGPRALMMVIRSARSRPAEK